MGTGLVMLWQIMVSMLFAGAWCASGRLGFWCIVCARTFDDCNHPHRIDRVMTFLRGDSASVEDAGAYHIAHAKLLSVVVAW